MTEKKVGQWTLNTSDVYGSVSLTGFRLTFDHNGVVQSEISAYGNDTLEALRDLRYALDRAIAAAESERFRNRG